MSDSNKNKGCLITVIVITAIIGVFKPVLLFIPALIIVIWIVVHQSQKAKKEKMLVEYNQLINNYKDAVVALAKGKNLRGILDKSLTIKDELDDFGLKSVLSGAYPEIIASFLAEGKLSKEEIDILNVFQERIRTDLPNTVAVSKIIDDGVGIDSEFATQMIRNLKLPGTPRERLVDIKINLLQLNGLKPETPKDAIAANKTCYYFAPITVMRIRSKGGERYHDVDKKADIYVFDKTIELVFNGHRVINLSDVLQTQVYGTELLLTIRNLGAPLIIDSPEARFIESMIRKII